MVVALGGVDAALETIERALGADVGVAFGVLRVQPVGGFHLVLEDLDLDAAETAEKPFVGDEGIDQVAGFGSGGAEAVVIFGGEGLEGLGLFAGEGLGFGVDAGFQGILGRSGLALDGAGAGGFLRVAAVGFQLFEGRHK